MRRRVLNQTTTAPGSPPAQFQLTSFKSWLPRRAWGDAQTLGGRVRAARARTAQPPGSYRSAATSTLRTPLAGIGWTWAGRRRPADAVGNIGLLGKTLNHERE